MPPAAHQRVEHTFRTERVRDAAELGPLTCGAWLFAPTCPSSYASDSRALLLAGSVRPVASVSVGVPVRASTLLRRQ